MKTFGKIQFGLVVWLLACGGAWAAPVGPLLLQNIPNCQDTGGQHLNYNNTSGAVLCGTSSGGGLPGGTSGQVQYNNSGVFGGFTASGDATINTGTGAVAVTQIGGVSVNLGGAFSTSGAFTTAITVTGATTVTLPTSGVLLGSLVAGTALSPLTVTGATSGLGTVAVIQASGSNVPMIVQPSGTGGFALQVPDGAITGGNALGANAVSLQTLRSASTQTATGTAAFVMGRNNTATGSNAVAMGASNQATANNAVALGNTVSVSGLQSGGWGQNVTVTGANSFVFGNNISDRGRQAIICFVNGRILNDGDSTSCLTTFKIATSSATPTRVTSTAGTANVGDTLNNVDNSVYAVRILCVARNVTTPGNYATWLSDGGMLTRETGAATTVYTGTAAPAILQTKGTTTGWAIAVAADTTNGGLSITVTGVAATTINWTCTIQSTEVN